MPTLAIKHLNLSLRGVSAATAQSAVAELGPALAQALAAQPFNPPASGALHIGQLDPAPVRIGARPTAHALSTVLARQIATAVSRQVGPTPSV